MTVGLIAYLMTTIPEPPAPPPLGKWRVRRASRGISAGAATTTTGVHCSTEVGRAAVTDAASAITAVRDDVAVLGTTTTAAAVVGRLTGKESAHRKVTLTATPGFAAADRTCRGTRKRGAVGRRTCKAGCSGATTAEAPLVSGWIIDCKWVDY